MVAWLLCLCAILLPAWDCTSYDCLGFVIILYEITAWINETTWAVKSTCRPTPAGVNVTLIRGRGHWSYSGWLRDRIWGGDLKPVHSIRAWGFASRKFLKYNVQICKKWTSNNCLVVAIWLPELMKTFSRPKNVYTVRQGKCQCQRWICIALNSVCLLVYACLFYYPALLLHYCVMSVLN